MRYAFRLLFAVVAVLSSLEYLVAQDWQRQLPIDSGWRLEAVSVVDSMHAWACGWHDSAAGLVVRTTDGGEHWTEMSRTVPLYINDIHFVTSSRGWIVGAPNNQRPGYMLRTTDGGGTWETQLTDSSNGLRSVFWLDEERGWVCGDSGKILATTNGGAEWQTQFHGRRTMAFTDIFLYPNGKGWCGGSGAGAAFLSTTNFGVQWDSISTTRLWQFSFLNDSLGWAVDQTWVIWKTTDGGRTWSSEILPYPLYYATNAMDVAALSDSLILTTLLDYRVDPPFDFFPATLLNLARGLPPIETRAQILFGIDFTRSGHGFAVGLDDIVSSRDSGRTWMNQAGTLGQALRDIDMADSATGWAVGDKELILHTTDGGAHWKPQTAAAPGVFWCVAAIDDQHAFAGGTAFMSTTNGGTTWVKSALPELSMITDLSFLDRQRGWAATNQYKVLQTTDGGVTWQEQPVPVRLWSIDFVDSLCGWCAGESGLVYATTNGGMTWTPQVSRGVISSVDFVDRDYGWVAGGNLVLRTMNGGIDWLTSDSSQYPFLEYHGVCFANRDTGWAVGAHRRIVATTNGGVSWVVQSAGGEFDPYYYAAVDAVSTSLAWVSGHGGTILHTRNGGGFTGVKVASGEIPEVFDLDQNYPNPFNASTIISFTIPHLSFVTLKVYDVLGQEVATLVNEEMKPARYESAFDGSGLASGVYIARLVVANEQRSQVYTNSMKLMLMK